MPSAPLVTTAATLLLHYQDQVGMAVAAETTAYTATGAANDNFATTGYYGTTTAAFSAASAYSLTRSPSRRFVVIPRRSDSTNSAAATTQPSPAIRVASTSSAAEPTSQMIPSKNRPGVASPTPPTPSPSSFSSLSLPSYPSSSCCSPAPLYLPQQQQQALTVSPAARAGAVGLLMRAKHDRQSSSSPPVRSFICGRPASRLEIIYRLAEVATTSVASSGFSSSGEDGSEPAFSLVHFPTVDPKVLPEQSWAYRNLTLLAERLATATRRPPDPEPSEQVTCPRCPDDPTTAAASTTLDNYPLKKYGLAGRHVHISSEDLDAINPPVVESQLQQIDLDQRLISDDMFYRTLRFNF